MTGTALTSIFNWVDAKLKTIEYGSISISFMVCDGQVTRVDKQISETEKISLTKKQS
jgi:hypothetical protein